MIAALQSGRARAHGAATRGGADAARDLGSLTAKPVLYVVNVDEGSEEVPAEIAAHAAAQGAGAVAVSSRIEAELAELDDEEAAAMRAELMRERRGRSHAAAASRPGRLLAAAS